MAEAGTDEVYAAMDWLVDRQDSIEAKGRRHLALVPAEKGIRAGRRHHWHLGSTLV